MMKKKLVILGSGWAGFRILLDIDTRHYDVTVVSPRNHFLFTPLLTSTAVGTLEFRGVVRPIRGARRGTAFLQAYGRSIDTENRNLHAEMYYSNESEDSSKILPAPLQNSAENLLNEDVTYMQEIASYLPSTQSRDKVVIPYDELVIAVGAVSNTFGIQGVKEYCFFMKQLKDARNVRQKILECFERAESPIVSEAEKRRLLHFVVVGGGPTSVELAAEIHDFVVQDVRKWYPELEPFIKISLIEAGKKLLGAFDASLSDYVRESFNKRNIETRTGVAVKEVTKKKLFLSDGTDMDYELAVWSTGNGPNKFATSLPYKKAKNGRLIVDDHFRLSDGPGNVYAIGDCAAFEENPLAQTAQVAEQEGKYLAKLLNRKAKGEDIEAFEFHFRGMLAYIGGHEALLDTPYAKRKGFTTWLMWNAAYLTQLTSIRNKIVIPLYWAKSFIFGRDLSRF